MCSIGKAKTKSSSTQQQDPWEPSIEPLKSFLSDVMAVDNTNITPKQNAAFAALEKSAKQGDPFAAKKTTAANAAIGYDNSAQSGMVTDANEGLAGTLGAYTRGDYLDPMSNPQMAAMLETVGSDVQDRINRMFAGAGRDLSGANQTAVAKGVTAAQLPLLLEQFNAQQDKQIGAAQAVANTGISSAGQLASLDQVEAAIRAAGFDLGDAATAGKNYSANTILNLEQQKQQLPYENLALLGSLLMPLAGVGAQSEGTSKGKSSSFSISDERAKENIARIGVLDDGQPVYRFTYRGDTSGRVHIGLMAQDVEKVMPDAVREFDGIKAVDYGAATAAAARIHAVNEQRRGM